MKNSICFLFVVISSLATLASAQTPNFEPSVVDTTYHTGYVPNGFDTNDNVQVVGEGLFSDTCYRPARPTWKVQGNNIIITPQAYFYNGFCLQMLVPHHEVIELGVLKSGTYTLYQKGDAKSLGQLSIQYAKVESADDYLYAPISQAYYKKVGQQKTLHLNGEFTNSCMTLSEVRVDVQPKVIVIQPISEMKQDGNCHEGVFPFQKTVELDSTIRGRYLLHVRSLNAQAINNLVTID